MIFFRIQVVVLISAMTLLKVHAQRPLQYFKLQEVELLPGVFQEAQQTDLKYILSLDADKLLAPYLREAGLPKKADSYGNWESGGLDGHTGGHYLSALAMMYAATGNKRIEERLQYTIAELGRCQEANGDGYIGGVPGSKAYWAEIRHGNIAAQSKKWVPLYNIHKVYAGLRDAFIYTGNEKAKTMLLKFSDWFVHLVAALSSQKMEEMLRTEHGGINEVLADVYEITGSKKYLDAAYSFSHKAVLEPLKAGQDKLNGLHANTQIPKIVGFKRIADVNNDSAYNKAAHFFWQTVVKNRTVAIGGNSVHEHFNPSNNFSSMIESEEGPETCNTYNMLKLTKQLYSADASVNYIDYYERALYNHILSSQHPSGGFVYFTPMRPNLYRVYSQPQTSMWCCVGTGLENHAKYGEAIYAHDNKSLYVNLFVPSKLQWKEKGLVLTQQTRFPEEEKTAITINAAPAIDVAIHIRYPSWVANSAIKVAVNGKNLHVTSQPSSYIAISRLWKRGDKIEVLLPMQTKAEQLPDGSNYVAIIHGPIVLAAKTDTSNMPGLFADDSRMGHAAKGPKYPLHETPMFVTDETNIASQIFPVKDKPLTFQAPNLIYPDAYDALELIPFYKLHNSRYVIYWQQETLESLKKIEEKLATEEAAAVKLQAATIDMVRAGEQQPEADHLMQSEASTSGIFHDRHYRDATGWFSYLLIDKQGIAGSVRITYWGGDKDRRFSILVNDEKIADVELDGSAGNNFYTVDYKIPDAILRKAAGQLKLKFLAAENSIAGVFMKFGY